jgi:hypothetical protein
MHTERIRGLLLAQSLSDEEIIDWLEHLLDEDPELIAWLKSRVGF